MPTIPRLSDRHKSRNIYFNRSAEYYDSKVWRDLRNYYIKLHPLCERCLESGKVTPAEHVHHIIPFLTGSTKADKIRLLTNQENLMSLCYECHRQIHREMDGSSRD